jgi:hypothetical protein
MYFFFKRCIFAEANVTCLLSNYKIRAGTNDNIKTSKQKQSWGRTNLGKLTGERCANSEANKQASWDWVDSSDQADPLGGPINCEADWLRPAQRNLGRPSRPRPD